MNSINKLRWDIDIELWLHADKHSAFGNNIKKELVELGLRPKRKATYSGSAGLEETVECLSKILNAIAHPENRGERGRAIKSAKLNKLRIEITKPKSINLSPAFELPS